MSRIWFSQDLETVGMFWRVARRDGVTLGFTTHDADLWFDGVLHRAAPGMTPQSRCRPLPGDNCAGWTVHWRAPQRQFRG